MEGANDFEQDNSIENQDFEQLRKEKLQLCDTFIAHMKNKPAVPHKTQIIIIGTGGTFQSAELDDGRMAPEWKLSESLKALQLPADDRVEMYDWEDESRLFELFTADSANMWVQEWSILWEVIGNIIKEIPNYADWIIVTHGTDTMARCSSYLSYMLQNLPIPVIVTWSQRPARQKWSDAREKLEECIWTIQKAKETGVSEVALLCGTTLVRWTWAQKVGDETDNAFTSFNDPKGESVVSHMNKNTGWIIFPQLLDFSVAEWSRDFLPHTRKHNPHKPFVINTSLQHDADTLFIPTTDISDMLLREIIKPVNVGVFELLWSATANDRIIDTVEEFSRRGKLILFRSPFHDSSMRAWHYSAGAKVSQMNVPILNTSPDSLRAKINYVSHRLGLHGTWKDSDIGQIYSPQQVQDFWEQMSTNMVWELVE